MPTAICYPFLSLSGERGVLFRRSEGLVPFSFTYLHFCSVLGELVASMSENMNGKKSLLCSTVLSLPLSRISLEWWTAFICLWMGPFYCTFKTAWILKIMMFLHVSSTTQKLILHLDLLIFFSIFLWGEDDSCWVTFPDKT